MILFLLSLSTSNPHHGPTYIYSGSDRQCYELVTNSPIYEGMDLGICRDVKAADSELNNVYRRKYRSLPPDRKRLLLISQREWLHDMHLRCYMDSTGDIRDEATPDCFVAEANKRIEFIRKF